MSTAHDRAKARQKREGKALDNAVRDEARARRNWRSTSVGGTAGPYARAILRKAKQKTRKAELAHRAAKRKVAATKPKPLRERAYAQAVKLIGVMEQGGNNQGPKVTEIIRANGGPGPEPWCGDFMAYVYRKAGSKSVTRAWAAVRLYLPMTGLSRTSSPQRGDIVRFNFPGSPLAHVGMFVKRVPGGIETIEGNTGRSGAVSDSATGGDGVYRKVRPTSQVADYIRVSR